MEIKTCREKEPGDAKARREKGMGKGEGEEKEARVVAAVGVLRWGSQSGQGEKAAGRC